jgi:hypothetical protein
MNIAQYFEYYIMQNTIPPTQWYTSLKCLLRRYAGTSMACPIAAGLCLARIRLPSITPAQAKNCIQSTASL